MKLKHWQGYGTIDAKRVSNKKNKNGTKTLVISVTGMHEYGLVRDDAYDVFRWLVKRFAKDCPNYRSITDLSIHEPSGSEAVYTVTYRPETA